MNMSVGDALNTANNRIKMYNFVIVFGTMTNFNNEYVPNCNTVGCRQYSTKQYTKTYQGVPMWCNCYSMQRCDATPF